MPEPTSAMQDTEILSRISALKIQARNLVEGLLSGQHRSRHKGSSVEFAEYKDYSPGDEIRHIDWKVVGKTDKYHVKQFEQSTNLKCHILLDASGSMGYVSPRPESRAMNKMDYARVLAAALSYLLLKQFDAVGLILFNDAALTHIPPRSKPSHFQHILHGIAEAEPRGITRIGQTVNSIIERLPNRSLLIVISDLLAKEDDVLKNLRLVCARGIEAILFHVLHPDEALFPFEGDIAFDSLEDDPPVGLDAAEIREAYQNLIREQIDFYRKNCPTLGVDYVFMDTASPLEQALSYYLLKRKSLGKR
ncbi:MAG: DUF58 domain-containing protein [Nitrospinae bacterium]|nr:DUF58 domain-containing protein [Nitrospinota bacterium]